MKRDDRGEDRGSRGRMTVLTVVMTAFITTFTGSALNLSIPDIGEEMGADAGFVGWLITGYTLAVAAFSVPAGRLADITCRKTVLVWGLVIFEASCLAAMVSVSMAMLLTARIAQGIGASMIFSTNTAVLISAFPENLRGKVLGYSLASTYVGLSAGPVAGGFLNHNFGWRSVFIFTGILGIGALIAACSGLASEKAENREKSMDIKGCVLYCVFIVLLMYGLSEAGKGSWTPAAALVGAAFGAVFVVHELRADDPAVNVRLFTENRGYGFSNLAALMNYGATFAISYLISIYLQVAAGYSSQTAGLIMISQPVVMAALSPAAGRLSDRFSPFGMSSAGMALCAMGTCIFIFTDEDTELWIIIAALVITGLGFALFSSPNTNAVMSCVKKEDYGVASSVLATMRSIGHTLSMVTVTVIVTALAPGAQLADVAADTLIKIINVSFTVFAAICAAGVFISLKRK